MPRRRGQAAEATVDSARRGRGAKQRRGGGGAYRTCLSSALRERGVPFAAIYFEGEGHGFRRAPNIIRCLEGELSFYAQVLGFPHPADIEPVPVENLG